ILSGANTYTGATTIASNSIIRLGNAAGLGATNGGTTINNFGALDLNGQTGVAENITGTGSGVSSSGFIYNSSANAASLTGNIALSGTGRITVTNGMITISGIVSNASGSRILQKEGSGTLNLYGANTFSGGLTLGEGTVVITNVAAVGSGTLSFSGGTLDVGGGAMIFSNAGTVTSSSMITGSGSASFTNAFTMGASSLTLTNNLAGGLTLSNLTLGNASQSTSRNLTLAGSGNTTINGVISSAANPTNFTSGLIINAAGTTVTFGGNNTYTGGTTITAGTLVVGAGGTSGQLGTGNVTNNSALVVNRSDAITISNVISGSGTLTKSNNNTLTLSGTNTYTNDTVIGAGTLALSGGSAIANTAAITNTAGTLQVDSSETIGSLRGAGTTTLNGGAVTLTVNEAGTNTYAGAIGGAGGLTKTNTGRLILSGANTFTGATLVNAGTLVYNGTNTSSALTVNSGGTLMGSGSLGAVTVNSGGTINPGNSPGTLTVGAVTFGGGGNYNWQIYDATGAAGTGYDLLSGTSLNITADANSKFNLNLWSLSGINPDANGSATNFSFATPYTWTIGTFSGGITNFNASYFNINTASTNGTGGFANSGGGTFALATTNSTDLILSFTPMLANNFT
ncbi:MAG: hypothetical protein EBV83_08940, partial [Verrucomicrobia bacterium]|nr:hypothetical protein [Verrucomicrobiota bacterium]